MRTVLVAAGAALGFLWVAGCTQVSEPYLDTWLDTVHDTLDALDMNDPLDVPDSPEVP